MKAKEYYRKRIIELSETPMMKRLNTVVNIDKQSQICEEYARIKVLEYERKRNRVIQD